MIKKLNNEKHLSLDLESATGDIPYGMTNDYMFRAVLQENNIVLRGLIASLLHLEDDEIYSVEIINPIIIGEAIENKEFRLDVNVVLNNNRLINLEMQIANLYNWTNRSLSYLCRSFDNLNKGQKYNNVRPAIHIGILDFTLFPGKEEFYSQYKMMNINSHHIYNDNFALNVLDLSHIELATEDDKIYQIDYWAKFFKATTWEELKQMADNNKYIKEAANTIFILSAEEEVRKRCRDREDYYADIEGMKDMVDELKNEVSMKDNALAIKDSKITEQAKEIEALKRKVQELSEGLDK